MPPGTPNKPITAVVVDDSAVVRRHLADLLTAGGIDVIATASDPLFAWPKMNAQWPDVVVLDVEMPRMDGISFLRKIMAERPTPVVMCSTLTTAGATTTLQALAEGAVGFVSKPTLGLRDFLADPSNGLVAAVRAAAASNMRAMRRPAGPGNLAAAGPKPALPVGHQTAIPPRLPVGHNTTIPPRLPVGHATSIPPRMPPAAAHAPVAPAAASPGAMAVTTDRVIAIGSSTGGVQAIEEVLRALPRTTPGIVIVQHMPEKFTGALAERLNSLCAMEVKEAADGDRVITGRVLIAPGGRHMQLQRNGAQYVVSVRDGPLVNRHKPSVDVLFRSVAHCAGSNALGIILTGMGDDGAKGLLDMLAAGARTAAQDEASCVVFGMPREAIRLGAAEDVVALRDVAAWLLQRSGTALPGSVRGSVSTHN